MKTNFAFRAADVACMAALVVSTAANAQSSVTLYGSLDAGLGYVSNLHGAHAYIAEQGTFQADRFGFQGVEDIGAGRSVYSGSKAVSSRQPVRRRVAVPSSIVRPT